MKVQEIYKLAVELGIKNDFRSREHIQKHLKRVKEKFEKLGEKEKDEFDQDKLWNPYSDGRVHFDSGKPVRKILAGIDIGTGEVLLANLLGGVDLILGHHPLGKGLACLDEVMHLQADVLEMYGVPINIAEGVLKPRISEISRKTSPANVNQSIDAAKLLGMSIMNIHTPADNMVANFLQKKIKVKKFDYVGEILDMLKDIPEYKEATGYGQGPRLFAGHKDNRCGKIALTEITGGTEGSSKIYKHMAQAGIGTIIGMHLSEEHKEAAEKAHLNVIIAGHISSDNIGMNLFLDELEKKGIEIVTCSGITRVKRK
jgi:putative NIF3 family GTP cyclohydrolase 1 type 2